MRLDDLFRVVDDFTLPGGRVVAIRVLSDSELKIRDEEASRASAAVAREFANVKSKTYKNVVLPLEQEADDDTLRSLLVSIRGTEHRLEAVAMFPLDVIPLPDNASEEEIAEVEDARENDVKYVEETRTEHIKKRVEAYEESLEELDREALITRMRPAVSVPYSMSARQQAFVDWTIYLSTEKVFPIGDIEQMSPRVKDALYAKYREVDNIDPFGSLFSS